jgi:hypothetical protein
VPHETESPALPVVPRAEGASEDLPFHPDTPGHVMSPGTHVPRPQTMVGIGSIPPPKGSVPPAPLTEVAPAPEFRPEYRVQPVIDDATEPGLDLRSVPRPRPSETMIGATSPLHTAEDANTAVNLSSLSPADAGRILAAAEADGRSLPRRGPMLLAPAAGLPPPPPLRRSSFPPPPPPTAEPASSPANVHVAPHPLPPPPGARTPSARPVVARTSYPAPPPRRPNTLLLHGGSLDDAARSSRPAQVAGEGRSIGSGAILQPVVRSPTVRAGPPPPAEPAVEELSSGFLVDDSSEILAVGYVPPQPISSSSLVEDPVSNPDLLDVEEDPPPLAAFAVVAEADPFATPPPAPFVEAPTEPMELVPLAEPVLVSPDPFSRITEPTVFRQRPPSRPAIPVVPPPPPRPAWLVPALAIGGGATVLLAVGCIALAFKWTGARDKPVAATIPSASVASPAAHASAVAARGTSAVASPKAPTDLPGAPCVIAGAPHIVAPRALLRTGIETASSADRIALGVGLSEHEGFVVALDPSTFAAVGTTRAHTTDRLHRVAPILGATELTAFLESNRKHAAIEAASPVAAEPPFVLGVAHGKLIWAPSRTSTPIPLWPLESDVPIDALRAVALPAHGGYALVFRQGASLYLGALKADKSTLGDLVRVSGLGPQIGAPTIAAGTDHVLVAWADRRSPTEPWSIRSLKWHPGKAPGEPAPFFIPNVPEGAAVMSPALTSLKGGRFVLAWTEGAGALHVVRALALDASEKPMGTPVTVSADGVNAGEGMPVFTPDGRGAVVFLATPTGATASVVAVPVICPGGG